MSYLFTSERLGFRNWVDEDIPKMVAVSADPEVMEFFPATATEKETTDFIHRMQAMFDERGYCYFPVETLADSEFIGFIGMSWQTYESEFTPCTDIGWRLATAHWGQGYATEGAKRCLEYAFDELGLSDIKATTPRLNVRSEHVMKKIGMHLELEYKHHNLPADDPIADFLCYGIQA